MRHPHLLTPSLVAIAHGSRDPRAGATIAGLLALARARASAHGLAGLEARAAFLGHAPPAPLQVLTALAGAGGGHDVVVLPLLLTAAYHSGTDIPGLLAEATAGLPRLRIRYGEPLGPHPGLVRALERRLAEAGQDPGDDPARTAVVLASAGSSHPAANAAIARMASGWQAARGWRAVRPAYASAASPTPAEAVADLLRGGARRVVVASYLLAPGLFADRIRETSLAAGAAVVSAPLGASAEVADVLLDRYRQAAAGGLGHDGAIGQRDDARVSARLSARSRWVSAR
jgi:sirohydrochlorin ferrochelatase